MGRPLLIAALVSLLGAGPAPVVAAPTAPAPRPVLGTSGAEVTTPPATPAAVPRATPPAAREPSPPPPPRRVRRAAISAGNDRRAPRTDRRRPAPREPLSLDTDPPHLLPMAMSRAVYLWPASPRLRTAAWVAVHYFVEPPRTYRRFDPELVYQKADSFLVAQVGGAFRVGPVELSLAVPFVGLFAADFYEKGIVDRQVAKIDRADLRLAIKYGFRIRQGRDLWLLTPYVAMSAPTAQRERYELSLAGHPVVHYTGPPRAVSVLTGLAAGWRRRYWSAVMSIGGLVTVPVDRDPVIETGEPARELEASLLSAYQFGFTPFRDLGVTLALLHQRVLSVPVKEQRDLFMLAPGLRLQPYLGLYGHIGVMIPLGRTTRRRQPVMVTLQAGWEFR